LLHELHFHGSSLCTWSNCNLLMACSRTLIICPSISVKILSSRIQTTETMPQAHRPE
jgi:hypothetical protein